MSSEVNHPAHYASGKIEVIEAIEDWKLDFPLGNAVKYVARAGKKDPAKEIQDLEKAVWYIRRKIENLTAIKEGRAVTRPNDMNPPGAVRLRYEIGQVETRLIVEDEIDRESRVSREDDLEFAEACKVYVRENYPSAPEYHKAMIFKGADFGRTWERERA